mgnify:CR=1 FL=1
MTNIRYNPDTTEKTKRKTEIYSPKNNRFDTVLKEWSEQSFEEKVITVFRLIGTEDGWKKIKSDYADGNLDGYITRNGPSNSILNYPESIFMRKIKVKE